MRSIARHSPLVLIAFVLACLLAPPAAAIEGRHPETGVPAFTYNLPNDWTTKDATMGNLLLRNQPGTAVLVILNDPSSEPLEKWVMKAFSDSNSVPSDRKPEPIEISGFRGFTWFASITRTDGLVLDVEMSAVRIDADHVASASLLLVRTATPEQVTEARLVKAALKLVMR